MAEGQERFVASMLIFSSYGIDRSNIAGSGRVATSETHLAIPDITRVSWILVSQQFPVFTPLNPFCRQIFLPWSLIRTEP